jgi:hypothetical protein
MKKSLLIFVAICLLGSCKKEFDFDKFPQEWKLTSMSGQISNAPPTIPGEDWQESYLLNSDGTFTKTRIRNGVLSEATGTFIFKDLSDGKYLELTFETGISIIASCTQGVEMIRVLSEKMMSSTWSACDGPGMEYERIK